WVPPEEAVRRRQLRRREFIANLFSWQHSRKRLRQLAIFVALAVACVIAWVLVRQSLRHGPVSYGSLQVESEGVAGAHVYLDGVQTTVVTPGRLTEVTSGPHVVTVAKDGYVTKPPVRQVSVAGNDTATVKFELANVPYLGKVLLDVGLPGALTLYVDGQPYPVEDQHELQLPVGGHVFTPVRPGYLAVPAWRRVMVQRDETIRLEFKFQHRPDLGSLKVFCEPGRGMVYVNGACSGLAANGASIPVPAGSVEVMVVDNGWRMDPLRQIIQVLPGGRHELQCRAYPATTNMRPVALQARTVGANILLDGRWLPHVTPLPDLVLSPGDHFLNLHYQGRWMAEADRRINLDDATSRQLSLDF
ncbi:MAG: PEGA domain-containing protein, partial [Lentisphaeria bacterium]